MKRLSSVLVLFLFILFSTSASPAGDRTIPVEVAQLSDSLKRMYAPDKRVALFDVDYSSAGKNVILHGATAPAGAGAALLRGLAKADYKIMDYIQVLPDVKGLEGKTYGIISVSVANLCAAPDFSSEMMMQGLMEMPVYMLQHDGWVHIQTPDNYIAWIHRVGMHLVNGAGMAAWNNAKEVMVTAYYSFVYSKPDRISQTVSDVVAGNRLKWDGSKGTLYKVIYPDGRQGCIPKSIATSEKKWRSGLEQDAADIVRTAHTMIGVPYLWAGTSSRGVNCSGFVHTILSMHNIIISRDASQQAYVGEHTDITSDFSNLQPGDLIFFGRRTTAERKERVVHMGVYIGGKRFIHSQGDVHINSFDPLDELFDEYNLGRLLFTTHVLSYINKKTGLNTAAASEYYE